MAETDPSRSELGLAAASAAIAGCVDAIGFLKLGGLFVSYMGGTSTQAAVFLILRDQGRLASALTLVTLFVAGALVGGMVAWAAAARGRSAMLALVAVLLGAATLAVLLDQTGVAIGLTVLAMGVQNAVAHRIGAVEVGATFVTGILVRLGEGLAQALTRQRRSDAWAPYLLLWLSLVAGGAAGALVYARIGVLALAAPAAAALLLAVSEARRAPHVAIQGSS